MTAQLRRLLAPRTVVFLGGQVADAAVRQCRAIGYDGEIWPVHPTREQLGGVPCFTELAALPGVPDAAFVAVPREETVEVVGELARLKTGGVVCHASGFAESGEYGAELERELVAAAGDMALVGPNCLGLLNYLDGVALWPEQHGGSRVDRGVGIISQSGNIAQNLTMQRRSLPIAQLISIGNSAVTGVVDLVEEMLTDARISAIGLYLEELPDAAELSRVALQALRRRVPIIALMSGSSELGARVTVGHTSSLAGTDVLVGALFDRLGIGRVHDLETLLETLKLLHVHGALPGRRIASASCSGGEAALLADLAQEHGLTFPDLPAPTQARLRAVLGDRVSIRNPLDYHTYIWGDQVALTECFSALLETGTDCHLLMLDFPRADRCDTSEFEVTVAAYEAAQRRTDARACVVASLPECMPEAVGRQLMSAGVAPMQGIASCLRAVALAEEIGAAQRSVDRIQPLAAVLPTRQGTVEQLHEHEAKQLLAAHGLGIPKSRVAPSAVQVPALAVEIGFPVAVKVLSAQLTHKSDVGAVRVGLVDEGQVRHAVAGMAGLGDSFLVEEMVEGAVLELIVGIRRDPQVGLTMTVGAGGLLVELMQDAVTILLPATRNDVRAALQGLRVWPMLAGFRGQDVDLEAVLDAAAALAAFASEHAETFVELEVNPLLVRADGAVAVDALIRLVEPDSVRESAAS